MSYPATSGPANLIVGQAPADAGRDLLASLACMRTMFEHAPAGQGLATLDGLIIEANPALCAIYGRPREQVLGRPFWEFLHPDDHRRAGASIGRLLAGETERTVDPFRFVGGDGTVVEAEVVVSLLFNAEGRPDRLIAVIQDISERLRAERELCRRVAQQTAVAQLGHFVCGATAESDVLTEACRTVAELLPAEVTGILRLEPNLRQVRLVAGVGWPKGLIGSYSADAAGSQSGFTLNSPEPVLVEDLTAETRFQPSAALLDRGLRSGISVVIRGNGGPYGVLGAGAGISCRFTDDDASFVQSVANVVAGYLDREAEAQRTRHASLHDRLTGLPNRIQFLDHVEGALRRAADSKKLTAACFLDLDRFNLVNESLGHEVGDQLLVQVGARVRGALRRSDVLARFEGDEFAVLCEDLDSPGDAMAVADRIRRALGSPFDLYGRPVFVTASIGVAVVEAGAGDAAGLVSNADSAMYRAKSAGRNQVAASVPEMSLDGVKVLETTTDLHGALARQELRVFYQPVLRLRDGAVMGAEALLRWQHPTRGLLGPGEFIDLAEDTGLIVPIGAWVLEEACQAAVRWPARPGGEPLKVSVNVSARQFRDGDLLGTVTRALSASGLDPAALCLEITESMLMADAERSRAILGALKDLGVQLSVDDFGTGYSSLARLKSFPLGYLKIDRSFVDGLGEDDDDEAIVTSVVGLAHSIGMVVVAEGVETQRHLELLQALRCEAGQGWLWSRAVPEAEFLTWLEGRPAPERPKPSVAPPGQVMPSRPGPLRVLVVDDDPAQVELARVLLGASGHEVIPLDDPAGFAASVFRLRPDLVLMDLRMPKRSGLDLVQDLPDDLLMPPVVAVTGHTEWLGRPLLGAERFAGTIAKPIDPEAFAGQVEAFLAGAALSR